MDTAGLKRVLQRNPVMIGCAGLLALVLLLKLMPDTSDASSDHQDADRGAASPLVEAARPKTMRVGEGAVVTTAFLGCAEMNDFEQFRKLQRASDALAVRRFIEGHHCPYLEKGTRATVEDYSFMHQAFCMRPVGSTTCVWFPLAFLEPS